MLHATIPTTVLTHGTTITCHPSREWCSQGIGSCIRFRTKLLFFHVEFCTARKQISIHCSLVINKDVEFEVWDVSASSPSHVFSDHWCRIIVDSLVAREKQTIGRFALFRSCWRCVGREAFRWRRTFYYEPLARRCAGWNLLLFWTGWRTTAMPFRIQV